MKIRNGFVSNSSSSSFLLMTTLENHNKTLEKLSKYEKAVMQQIINTRRFLGKEVAYVGDLSPMDESYLFGYFSLKNYEEGSDPEAEKNGPAEALYNYEEELKKISDKDEVFNWSMG